MLSSRFAKQNTPFPPGEKTSVSSKISGHCIPFINTGLGALRNRKRIRFSDAVQHELCCLGCVSHLPPKKETSAFPSSSPVAGEKNLPWEKLGKDEKLAKKVPCITDD